MIGSKSLSDMELHILEKGSIHVWALHGWLINVIKHVRKGLILYVFQLKFQGTNIKVDL